MRVPDSFIQDLLARSDIVEIIGARLQLQRAGREYRARSPFTNEKTPSFFVNPTKQLFFDFSSGKNGNVITFLMEHDRLGFIDAVEALAQLAGMELPREAGAAAPVLDGPIDALALAERFYRAQLRSCPEAVEYLKKRGVGGETAKRFGIGYAPDSWNALALQFPSPAYAITAGLLIEREDEQRGGVYDRFRNRIMFPIHDLRGRVIAFGGRTLGNDPAKYLNSPETPLFHKGRQLFGLYEAKQATRGELAQLIVVEGYMDVVALAQHDITEAVATLGTATTREHLALLFKHSSRVVFCFDGDRAGRSAAWRGLEQALPEVHEGHECRFMFLPEGHDPDTLVREIGAEAFRERMAKSLSLPEFLLGELRAQVDLSDRAGRARLTALARPHVERMRGGALRDLVIDELARSARLARPDLEAAWAGTGADSRRTGTVRARTKEGAADIPGVRALKRALQLLLEAPALAGEVADIESWADSAQPGLEMLREAIIFFREHPGYRAAQLLEHWRDTAKSAALGRLGSTEAVLDEAASRREFLDALDSIRRRAHRSRAQTLLDIARARPLTEEESIELEGLTRRISARS